MKATFFVIPESFQYNGETQHETEVKISNFAVDLRQIKETPYDEVFCHADVYSIEIYKGNTISDILNDPKMGLLDRDVVQQLRIIWELNETSDSINDIKDVLLPSHNEDECYGLIAFNPIANVLPEYLLVYGIDSWYKFKRHFLGVYPKNADYFIDQCKLYYEKLFFHENNKISVKRLFPSCVKKILHHLAELNDKFPSSKTIPYNRVNSLANFNVHYNHDGQPASPEGDINKKNALTFKFADINGQNEDVYCELHLKISLNDDNAFSNDRRIYFHEGEDKIQFGKILIGHIGKHL